MTSLPATDAQSAGVDERTDIRPARDSGVIHVDETRRAGLTRPRSKRHDLFP